MLKGFMTQFPIRMSGPEGYYRAIFGGWLLPEARRNRDRWDFGDCTGRAVLAWTSLREMTGDTTTGATVEKGQRDFLLSLLRPESGLVYVPNKSNVEKGIYRYQSISTIDRAKSSRLLATLDVENNRDTP